MGSGGGGEAEAVMMVMVVMEVVMRMPAVQKGAAEHPPLLRSYVCRLSSARGYSWRNDVFPCDGSVSAFPRGEGARPVLGAHGGDGEQRDCTSGLSK